MKSLYVLSFVLALATVDGQIEGYTTKNDDFDMKSVVEDIDKLLAFAKCLNYEINCPQVGIDFLKDIPDAVKTSCVKCNEAQKKHFRLFVGGVKTKLHKEYEAFKNRFDPEGISFAQLEINVGLTQ